MTKATTNTKETSVVTSIDDAPDVALEKADADTPVLKIPDVHSAFAGDRVELVLNSTEGEVGHQAVFVSINGESFNIPRDTKVIVPVEVIETLDNASMELHEPQPNGTTKVRNVKRYSYTVKYLAKSK